MLEPGRLFGGDVDSAPSASEPASDADCGDNRWPELLVGANAVAVEHAASDAERDVSYSPSMDDAVLDGGLAKGYDSGKAVDRSWQQLDAKPLQQFWEQGFWGEIFGNSASASVSSLTTVLGLHRPAVVQGTSGEDVPMTTDDAIAAQYKRLKHATYMDVVSKCSIKSWQEQRDSTWETAIRRWHSSIMSWSGDDAIISLIQGKSEFKAQCQIVVDILYNKAPSTLLKRCNSLGRLVNDLHKQGCNFPCTEDELYGHLTRQREAGAPPSRLKSLLEAITFVRHIFGVTALEHCVKSRRCMGVATPKELEITKQAPPLRVEHLKALHHVMENEEDPWNVAFTGMVLFCVYGRARWGDAQHSTRVEWDMDSEGNLCFVECATAVHKTCRALNMKHSFLPLTAPGLGISANNWATSWRRARLELGIENLSEYPLMPAPDELGHPTIRPLSSNEACGWLTLLLRQKVDVLGVSEPLHYTSHSFKATTLSYLAKYGCSFEDRLALGYHVDQLRMALRYSRDGASRPLRVLETCLADIRSGRFLPDETRSGRFVGALEMTHIDKSGSRHVESEVKQETVLPVAGVFSAGEVVEVFSDHATTCSDSSSGDDAVVLPKNPHRSLVVPSGATVWKHTKLKTVHLAQEGYFRVLACGRKITGKYQQGGVDVRFDIIKCKQCFSSPLLQS